MTLLGRLRALSGRTERAEVRSHNGFPTAAGLASSASGFAALSLAAAAAYDLALSFPALSDLARQSSASAARSLFGGYVELRANGRSAEPVAPANHLRVAMLVVLTESGPKGLSSTEAMLRTAGTSPFSGG